MVPLATPFDRLIAPAMVRELGLVELLRLTLAGDAPDRLTPLRSVETWRLIRLTLAAPARLPRPLLEESPTSSGPGFPVRVPKVKAPLAFTTLVASSALRLMELAPRSIVGAVEPALIGASRDLAVSETSCTATEALPAIGKLRLSRP